MAYTVQLAPAAVRDLEARFPRKDKERIAAALRKLATDPRPVGVKKLAGERNLYRIRIGDYRIVYAIHDASALVLIERVAPRKDIYR